MKRVIMIAVLASLPLWASAKEAEFTGGDPQLHERVMSVSAELRCLVCQGQSLSDSNSDFARDMRQQIKEMMESGKSDREVVDFMVERYGDYVRYRPPFKATTVLLWFGPFLLLGLGVGVLYWNILRRKKKIVETPLSDADRRRAEALLQDQSEDGKA